jgi:hypothetical protein
MCAANLCNSLASASASGDIATKKLSLREVALRNCCTEISSFEAKENAQGNLSATTCSCQASFQRNNYVTFANCAYINASVNMTKFHHILLPQRSRSANSMGIFFQIVSFP